MRNSPSCELVLKEGLGSRLREARTNLGINQQQLADLGQVSRATQISYEADLTAPNTAYLRAIQPSGIDLLSILFDTPKVVLDEMCSNQRAINWPRLQAAHEHVEFFCLRNAAQCPPSYRWMMVSELYSSTLPESSSPRPLLAGDSTQALNFLQAIWDRYGLS